MAVHEADALVLGGGLFGLYAAKRFADDGKRTVLVEADKEPFWRASRINQARIHAGYHYPRSLATARSSLGMFKRFCDEFPEAINGSFKKVYAVAKRGSYTSARQFQKFCEAMGIRNEPVDPQLYFKPGVADAAFETEEFAFDAPALFKSLWNSVEGRVTTLRPDRPKRVERGEKDWLVELESGDTVKAPRTLMAAYSGTNPLLDLFGFKRFDVKYEISEVCLGKPSQALRPLGITMMDGPFFSAMPFGHSGLHTLTAVDYTPRRTSLEELPVFECQGEETSCAPERLKNCNFCDKKPTTAYPYMAQLAKKFLRDEFSVSYEKSYFAMKAILNASETDDSRPTLIRTLSESPRFVAVLSGKINTVHELDEALVL